LRKIRYLCEFIIISSRNINVLDAQDYIDDLEYKIGLSLIANEKLNLNLFLSLYM